MSDPLLAVEGVTRRFGGIVAVDRLTFAVEAGRVSSLIGPNGAGKSTVLNLIGGRYRTDEGRIRFRGVELPRQPYRTARRGVGRLFQDVRMFGSLTVLENVLTGIPNQAGEGIAASLFSPRRLRREAAEAIERAREHLSFVGLTVREDALAGSLSYGQQKLVALARLLASGAELLLLDEPASGVNPRLVDQMGELIQRIVAAGRTVLLVEHNLELVRRVSSDVILLDRGRSRAAGPLDEVWDSEVMREVYLAV